jgi:hypothetical protein
MMMSVFVASQSGCFSLCSREQIRLVESGLNASLNAGVPMEWIEIANSGLPMDVNVIIRQWLVA